MFASYGGFIFNCPPLADSYVHLFPPSLRNISRASFYIFVHVTVTYEVISILFVEFRSFRFSTRTETGCDAMRCGVPRIFRQYNECLINGFLCSMARRRISENCDKSDEVIFFDRIDVVWKSYNGKGDFFCTRLKNQKTAPRRIISSFNVARIQTTPSVSEYFHLLVLLFSA